jgi:tRNA-specific 2-thiouridylase
LFVVALDPGKRQVIVGPREALLTTRLGLRDVNWLGDGEITGLAETPLDIFVRVRSSQAPQPAVLVVGRDGTVDVELVNGEHGIAKGQACVFYDSDAARARVLGGGFIDRARNGYESALGQAADQEADLSASAQV